MSENFPIFWEIFLNKNLSDLVSVEQNSRPNLETYKTKTVLSLNVHEEKLSRPKSF